MNYRVESQLQGVQRPQREGDTFMFWTEGQEICNEGRREPSNPDTSEEGGYGETKAEAEGEEPGAGMEVVETSVDGLERVTATTFSGSGTWTIELVNSAR